MRRFIGITLATLATLATVGSVALAAPEERRAARQDAIREKIRTVRIARLVEALNLDAAGAARLMPVLDKGYDEIGLVTRQMGAARRELRGLLLAQRPDDARINQLVDQLAGGRGRIIALQDEMLRGVRKILSPQQVGHLVLVLPEIEKQLQQQIRRAARGPFGGKGGFAPDDKDPTYDPDDDTQ